MTGSACNIEIYPHVVVSAHLQMLPRIDARPSITVGLSARPTTLSFIHPPSGWVALWQIVISQLHFRLRRWGARRSLGQASAAQHSWTRKSPGKNIAFWCTLRPAGACDSSLWRFSVDSSRSPSIPWFPRRKRKKSWMVYIWEYIVLYVPTCRPKYVRNHGFGDRTR